MTVNHVPTFWVGMVRAQEREQKGERKFSLFCFNMNPVVYIIYSKKLNKFYIGKSENFTQRLVIHNSDENEKWSKSGRPWEPYLVINCKHFKQAGSIERYIKAQKSKKYIIQLKEKPNYLQNLLNRFSHDC
jgi:putative endonuclease